MLLKYGSYIWTASAAGWFVLGCIYEMPECFVISGTSLFVSWVFYDLARP